ncbi:MAG: adenylate/guanylate cyclase domain-containing protein [Chloroflexota bacterium]|nr:adenylate/guanylate cyclase domain-containing protein [Chloroflexota bacterium]
MDEPRIHYVRTPDGVSIAYYVIGGGPPLVEMPGIPVSHLQKEWETGHEMAELIAMQRTYIHYDARGFGMSDRAVSDFSLEALVRDLETVADHLSIERMQIITGGIAMPIALQYAATHPERVSHLVLGMYGAGREVPEEQLASLVALGEQNWELATETITHAVLGWSNSELARKMAEIMRAGTTAQTLKAFMRASREWQIEELLPRITASTLILARRDGPQAYIDDGRRAASFIPDARLELLDEKSDMVQEPEFDKIWAFVSDGQEVPRAAPEVQPTTATILFADIVDSTSLTERLGDSHFRSHASELDEGLRRVIRASGGTVIEGKVLGDGVMSVFPSARQAIDAALRCAALGAEHEMKLHLGIHAGDVIRDGANVYGGAVNIAARVAGASDPGEILVTDVVRALARTSASAGFDDRGEHELKGIAEPQHLYAIHDRGA